MKYFRNLFASVVVLLVSGMSSFARDGWVNLFDGKTLTGWEASEHPATFSVADGAIVVQGDRAHLL